EPAAFGSVDCAPAGVAASAVRVSAIPSSVAIDVDLIVTIPLFVERTDYPTAAGSAAVFGYEGRVRCAARRATETRRAGATMRPGPSISTLRGFPLSERRAARRPRAAATGGTRPPRRGHRPRCPRRTGSPWTAT